MSSCAPALHVLVSRSRLGALLESHFTHQAQVHACSAAPIERSQQQRQDAQQLACPQLQNLHSQAHFDVRWALDCLHVCETGS